MIIMTGDLITLTRLWVVCDIIKLLLFHCLPLTMSVFLQHNNCPAICKSACLTFINFITHPRCLWKNAWQGYFSSQYHGVEQWLPLLFNIIQSHKYPLDICEYAFLVLLKFIIALQIQ